MTVYENVATSTIVNLFNSNNREEYKTRAVFEFLISKINKKDFSDIKSVEEQKSTDGKLSIPDFKICFERSEKTFEVKINNAKLTASEQIEKNRDFFLINMNYKYQKEIEATNAKILYWEDLFDELDEKGIVIDGLDKIRNVINYPKIDISSKLFETLLYLKSFYPKIEIDLRNIKQKSNGKIDIDIPLFPDEKGNAKLSLKLFDKGLIVSEKKEETIMSFKDFMRKTTSVLALEIYDKLQPILSKGEPREWKQSNKALYDKIIETLKNHFPDNADYEDKSAFWYSDNQYAYFCLWQNKDIYGFELGFGHLSDIIFQEKEIKALKTKIEQIKETILKDYITKVKQSYQNEKWVGFQFFYKEDSKTKDFINSIYKAMKYMLQN